MIGFLSLGWWVMRSPLVWLWRGYRGLWWAFGDAPAAVPNTAAAGQDTAFQMVDSTPARITLPHPDGLLRIGFTFTSAASVLLAAVLMLTSDRMSLTPMHATMVWVWLTLLAAVISLFWVRYVAMKRHANRSAWSDARASIARAARVGGSAAAHGTTTAARVLGRGAASLGKNFATAAERFRNRKAAAESRPPNQ